MHFALWPYALRNTTLLHNNLPVLEDGTLRLELFSLIRVGANMKHMHTFGCPVFALQNVLALGKQLPRWLPRARLGLNLGPSPNACEECVSGTQLKYRVCLTAVSLLLLQQFF